MSSAPAATFSGLASGIQWQDTVNALIQIESQPMYRLEERKIEEQTRIDAWVSISSKLSALQSAAQAIDTANELLAMNATSSDNDLLTVSATASAIAATHNIEVNQLAQQEVYVHDTGWDDLNQTSLTGSGTDFSYQYDGETRTLTLAAGSTLADLIEAINDDEDNPGVSASSIDDGTDTNSVHLVLTANDASDTNSIAINDGTTTIGAGAFDTAGWVRTKDAQQAQIRVDGYPPADWIYRDSNTIEDVIDGVTLNLKDVTTSDVQVTVSEDKTETKNAIEEFVSAYNALIVELEAKTRYDAENEIRGLLASDSSVRSLKSDVLAMVAGEIPGVSSSAVYKTLGSIGVEMTSGGKLKVDSGELDDAIEADADAVADLFALEASSDNVYISFFKQESETIGGEYEVTVNYSADGTIDASASNTIGGYAATVESGHILVGQEGTPVEGLRIYFDGPGGGPGTETATIRIGKGVASQFDAYVDIATDSIDGSIKQAKEVYEDSIESIDKQIEAFQDRLAIKRDILTRQFLAMEQAVSAAQAQSSWF